MSAVTIGDSEDALVDRLRAEFPAAILREDRSALRDSLSAILLHLDGQRVAIDDLPLDVRATAFERRVWSALQQIPRGSRATYAEVAAMIGAPGAARAVARACAANPVALVVPCHRVVPAAGGTGRTAGARIGKLPSSPWRAAPGPRAGNRVALQG